MPEGWSGTFGVSYHWDERELGLGAFEVTGVTTPNSYKLKLPFQLKVLSVFRVSLLEPYHKNRLKHRKPPPAPPIGNIIGEDN